MTTAEHPTASVEVVCSPYINRELAQCNLTVVADRLALDALSKRLLIAQQPLPPDTRIVLDSDKAEEQAIKTASLLPHDILVQAQPYEHLINQALANSLFRHRVFNPHVAALHHSREHYDRNSYILTGSGLGAMAVASKAYEAMPTPGSVLAVAGVTMLMLGGGRIVMGKPDDITRSQPRTDGLTPVVRTVPMIRQN